MNSVRSGRKGKYRVFLGHFARTSTKCFSVRSSHSVNKWEIMRADKGLTLETSTLETLYSGQFTIKVDSTILSCYTPPPTRYHSFLRNLPPLEYPPAIILEFVFSVLWKRVFLMIIINQWYQLNSLIFWYIFFSGYWALYRTLTNSLRLTSVLKDLEWILRKNALCGEQVC